MITFERIKELAKQQGKSLNKIEEELGYGKNVLYRLKDSKPSAERLEELANYFDVSVDYLLGRTDSPKNSTKYSKTKDLTVEEALDSVMSYDGKTLSDNDREVLKGIIEAYLSKKE
ncbi:helix-turn-helix domain-containing protein [Enterococcus hirae]|uniref:helix-turn-helix domain-containing protein n=1 Tax=Enterococcus hirae TaxID=1354 RepID=UPI002DB56255|nr:helix-turn-helix transcriptional regulator [Enterococcus hirae]MEB5733447.1 helix-turn-helix domain-containing protein [Enterococcus hirae]